MLELGFYAFLLYLVKKKNIYMTLGLALNKIHTKTTI